MRASAHKSARRNLASSKRSIVMVCAGIAMILGATNVGASLFSNNDSILQRERSVSNTFNGNQSVKGTASDISSQALRTLAGQKIVILSQPALSPGISIKSVSGNTTINLNLSKAPAAAGISAAIVGQIQPSSSDNTSASNTNTTSSSASSETAQPTESTSSAPASEDTTIKPADGQQNIAPLPLQDQATSGLEQLPLSATDDQQSAP